MHIEDLRDFVLALPEVEETTPFGPNVIVYKTKGKMFLLVPLDTDDLRCNVKCAPERAIQLRKEYPEAVLPGYHMSKIHWNTIIVGKGLTKQQYLDSITDSYELIRKGSKK
jgi:predicted DNA-binding protein (MmcQ/YjbR family)